MWANHSHDPMPDARTRARMAATHVAGVVKTIGVERACIVLAWLNWPKESYTRVHSLTSLQPLIKHFETRFTRKTS